MRIDALLYAIDTHPLEDHLVLLPLRPPRHSTPFTAAGYVATWAIHEDTMYLIEITSAAYAQLFSGVAWPVAASWLSGFIHGTRGDSRYTGYPARKFFDDEIVLELVAGKVVREWRLDLRALPNKSSEERRRSVPPFLFKSD